MYVIDSQSKLKQEHYTHLMSEGFSPKDIAWLEAEGVKSITKAEAIRMGYKVWDKNNLKAQASSGCLFPFSSTHGQVRVDDPIYDANGERIKYVSSSTPAAAWRPEPDCKISTEGFKDAAIATLKGIPCIGLVGTWNTVYCLEQGCNVITIFDSDGWFKPGVMDSLIESAIWTEGKINLLPKMTDFPTGGMCEFFKAGYTVTDLQSIADQAMKPAELIERWVKEFIPQMDSERVKGEAIAVATKSVWKLNNASQYVKVLQQKRAEKIAQQ